MPVPTGGDVAIYDSKNKRPEHRVIIGVEPPGLFAQFVASFDDGSGPDPRWFGFSQYAGPPLIDGGMVRLQQIGGPQRMWFQTRENCFPTLLNPTAIQIHMRFAFPDTDPVFSQVVTVGSVHDSPLGPDNEPWRITQHASMRAGSGQIAPADIGKLFFSMGGTFAGATPSFTNDQLLHDFDMTWDAGNAVYSVDSVEIFDQSGVPRPDYIKFGMEQQPEDYAIATAGRKAASLTPNDALVWLRGDGTAAQPDTKDAIVVAELTISADTYDLPANPSWTLAPLGNFENAIDAIEGGVDGERFPEEKWGTMAIVPKAQIVSWENPQGASLQQISDTMTVTLATPNRNDPNDDPLFVLDPMVGRPIALYTRITDTSVPVAEQTSTNWVLQYWGIVTDKRIKGDQVVLESVDWLSDRLDTFMPRGYLATTGAPGAKPSGNDGAYANGLKISAPDDMDGLPDSILSDLVWITNALRGGRIPPSYTYYQFRLFDHKPIGMSSGGQSLLPSFAEIVERCGLHWYRGFQDASAYGQHFVAARTLTGDIGYVFRGQGTGDSNIDYPEGIEINESRRDGIGQMNMRQDSPSIRGWQGHSFEFLLTRGLFPSGGPYPINDRVWDDSSALITGFGLGTLNVFHDSTDTPRQGGVPFTRYKAATAERRRFNWEVVNHDWVEPFCIVGVDDKRSGVDGTEPVVILNRVLSWSADDGHMRCRMQGVTGDYLLALQRSM